VVMYHRFGEGAWPTTSIRLEQFEAHIRLILDGGYTVLALPDIIDRLARGEALPDRSLAITIDDAFASIYTEAWPRLKDAGLPFTIFVATDPVDAATPGYLSWDQLREMAADGVYIGHHGASHGHYPGMTAEQAAADIARASARFEAELGAVPTLFAWPFGETSAALMPVIQATGMRAAFGQHSGVLYGGEERFYLPRFALNENFGDADRFRLIAGTLPLPVSAVTPADPSPEKNPPDFGFTVMADVAGLDRMACYASGQGQARIERLGPNRFEVRMAQPFATARARVNCTVPGPDGRWRWFGRQFYYPSP
ncbi:MAG: polysaccharide deacetylase family protein, partial [Alphaproteobacteria bacterium]